MDESDKLAKKRIGKKGHLTLLPGRGRGKVKTVAVSDITMSGLLYSLLPASEDMVESVAQCMRSEGFYESEPVVLGTWPGQEKPVVIDGHIRVRAAVRVGITHVPCVTIKFESEVAVLEHTMYLQTKRRPTTDGVLYRLYQEYDKLTERDGDTRAEEVQSKASHVALDSGQDESARRIASLLGCNHKTIKKIQKICSDGTFEIQLAVRFDKMTINTAYKRVLGNEKRKNTEEGGSRKSRAKASKTVISQENLARLNELGGELDAHVNKALEMYVRSLHEEESL